VLPYCPYARQDKPSFMKREAALASLFADQLKVSGADACLTYHPHTTSLYGFYEPEIKLIALSGLDLFEAIFRKFKGKKEVVVMSTDAGGAKTTVHFADKLNTTYAISNKFRHSKDDTSIIGVIGDLRDKRVAIITDDETVTGSSILNPIKTLYNDYGIEEIYAAISHFKVHGKHFDKFIEAHEKYGLKELHITNSIPHVETFNELKFIQEHSLTKIIAATINKLHYNQSVSQIFSRV
jgi:ribose-phosphate pyrophosphokinase